MYNGYVPLTDYERQRSDYLSAWYNALEAVRQRTQEGIERVADRLWREEMASNDSEWAEIEEADFLDWLDTRETAR